MWADVPGTARACANRLVLQGFGAFERKRQSGQLSYNGLVRHRVASLGKKMESVIPFYTQKFLDGQRNQLLTDYVLAQRQTQKRDATRS